MPPLRKPAVAGSFYPSDPKRLTQEMGRCLDFPPRPKKRAVGVVSPHAGSIYSGRVAGELYSQINIPDRLILLSPNHTGYGVPFSIWPKGSWETPLGKAKVDEELAASFMNQCPLLEEDEEAHQTEHSIEVQIPFLQFLKKQFAFVPLTLSHVSYSDCVTVGHALAKTIRFSKKPVLIVASSDMNHYENQKIAEEKDRLAIEQILRLDPKGLYETVHQKRISMCGVIPTTVMLVAAQGLEATKAELVRHATSGEVTKDYGSVVGYASLIVS
ncbi:MAG: AmmeMemoRadiSam system protein B [Deltaproteobacteria bacterium]|nr:AmmeMemoRadiSam system protein B [Deltaproteobacteria bacterium]